MFCPKCGTELNEGDAFCYKCGAPMRKKENAVNNAVVNKIPEKPVNNSGNVIEKAVDKGTVKKKKIGSIPFIICLVIFAVIIGAGVFNFIKYKIWEKTQNSSESKEEIKVTTVNVGNYKITIPEEYKLSESDKTGRKATFTNTEGNTIIIFVEEANGVTGDDIKQNTKAMADYFYKELGLNPMKNTGITSSPDYTSGDFKGVQAKFYAADKDLCSMFIASNNVDICKIALFGMSNYREVAEIITIK